MSDIEEPNHDGTERATEKVEEMGGLPENPFSEVVQELRDDGESWNDIYEMLNATFGVVDEAALEEQWDIVPEWEVVAIVPDEKSTSGERYERYERTAKTPEEAERMIERKHNHRVDTDKTEKIGYTKLS